MLGEHSLGWRQLPGAAVNSSGPKRESVLPHFPVSLRHLVGVIELVCVAFGSVKARMKIALISFDFGERAHRGFALIFGNRLKLIKSSAGYMVLSGSNFKPFLRSHV